MNLSLILKLVLIFILSIFNNQYLLARDLVKGGFSNCFVNLYDYKENQVDSSSKKNLKFIIYNDIGLKIEENIYWQGKLSFTNNYFYDSLNNLILNVRKSSYYYYNYSIKYFYDVKGNNTKIYCYLKGDTIIGHQEIKYNYNGKETEHIYYSFDDSVNVIEFFKYNEKGLLVMKKISAYRDRIMDTYEYYKYDSNDVVIEINIERIPELVSRVDVFYWVKDELGYTLHGAIPLPPLEKRINFYYDEKNRLSKKRTYYGDYAAINYNEYFYDEFSNIIREIVSSDYSTIQELFKSKDLGYLYEELAPIHFKSKTGEPSQEIIYYYTK